MEEVVGWVAVCMVVVGLVASTLAWAVKVLLDEYRTRRTERKFNHLIQNSWPLPFSRR